MLVSLVIRTAHSVSVEEATEEDQFSMVKVLDECDYGEGYDFEAVEKIARACRFLTEALGTDLIVYPEFRGDR